MASEDDNVAAVQKVLGEPVYVGLDQKTTKVKITLFLVSAISIVYVLGDLSIQEGSTFLGLKFDGLNDNLFVTGLFATTLYFSAHFLWVAFDSLLEWRIRVTGTRVAFITAAMYTGEHGDYPGDPRQSSLSNWWQGQARSIGIIEGKIDRVIAHVDATNLLIEALKGDPNIHNVVGEVQNVRNEIIAVKGSVESIHNTLEANRIPVSLIRYERWFSLFLRSQNLRWLIIEFLLPILIAGYALLLLGSELF